MLSATNNLQLLLLAVQNSSLFSEKKKGGERQLFEEQDYWREGQ